MNKKWQKVLFELKWSDLQHYWVPDLQIFGPEFCKTNCTILTLLKRIHTLQSIFTETLETPQDEQ